MAYKNKQNCLANVEEQMHPKVNPTLGYRYVVVWTKNWNVWSKEIADIIQNSGDYSVVTPKQWTKNQTVVGVKTTHLDEWKKQNEEKATS